MQFCMARNWVVRNFYPVHSFLKPAAFDCGPLHAISPATSVSAGKPIKTKHQKSGEKLCVDVPKEQSSKEENESSPLHRHGSSQNKLEWPSQTSITVIG